MDRRAFLKTSAAVAASSALPAMPVAAMAMAGPVPEGSPAQDGYETPEWLRYSRTIFYDGGSPPLYPHMTDFDAERMAKVVTRLNGNTLRFQPIGIWAYYPSKVYPVCPELNGRDLIEEMSRECRKRGIHIYCYCKFGNPSMTVGWVDSHPEYAEWALRGPDGKPYGSFGNYGWNDIQKPCSTSTVYRQAIRQVVRELSAHDIDGVYFDAPSAFEYTDICYCPSCRTDFHTFSGMDLDRLQNKDDMEARIAWFRWWNQNNLDDLEACRTVLHESGKFLLCHNGGTWRGTSLRAQYRIPDGFMVEHSPQIYMRMSTGLMGASMARPYRKVAQMYMGGYCVSDFEQPPHCRPIAVHNTNMEDSEEILMEGFTDLACGNLPLYATLGRAYYGIGSGSDHPVREVYDVMQRAELLVKDSVPVPYVTVVPSWEALQVWRTNRETWNAEMDQGFVLAMLDERLSVDVCPSTEVMASCLEKQRVIALCGASGVSAEQADLLTDWVRNGGSLLATYDTGMYDGEGRMKPGGMLRDVLGVEMKGEPGPGLPESYYRPLEVHPALRDYRPGDRFMGDTQLIPVVAAGTGKVLADCWCLGTKEVRGPAIIANNYGKGRTIYVAGSLEGHYVSSRVASLRTVLGSMVRYLGHDAPPPFMLDAPRGVYGVLRQTTTGDRVVWVLANVGFKDADIGRMRQEFVPLSNVQLKILVPEGRTVKAVHLVRLGQSMTPVIENGYAAVEIPKLHVAEIVHFELA